MSEQNVPKQTRWDLVGRREFLKRMSAVEAARSSCLPFPRARQARQPLIRPARTRWSGRSAIHQTPPKSAFGGTG